MSTTDPVRLIGFAALAAKGITYSRQHLHRLIRARKFPRPVKMGASGGYRARNAWIESEIDTYIASRIAERDVAAPAA